MTAAGISRLSKGASLGIALRTRAMDHRPLTPDAISAAPRKKGSSRCTRSKGDACRLAAVYMPTSVTPCTVAAAVFSATGQQINTFVDACYDVEYCEAYEKRRMLKVHDERGITVSSDIALDVRLTVSPTPKMIRRFRSSSSMLVSVRAALARASLI